MTGPRCASLLVGSPRRSRSTSASLGGYILKRLADHGVTPSTCFLEGLPSTAAGDAELLATVRAADLLIISFPLYVDAPPAAVIRAMAVIAESRYRDQAMDQEPGFVAIVNCGFPEAHQADVALAISQRFAAACRFRWLGGMAVGLGAMLDGRPLGKGGARLFFKHVEHGLELAAGALARGEAVPELARELLARPVISPAGFVPMGNLHWWVKAAAREVQGRLREQPYRR